LALPALALWTGCGGGSMSSLTLTGDTWPMIINNNEPAPGDEYHLDPYFGIENQIGARGFWLNNQAFDLWGGTGAATVPYFTIDPSGNVKTGGSVTVAGSAVVSAGSGPPAGACSPGSYYTRTDAAAGPGAEAYVCRMKRGPRKGHAPPGAWHALAGG
jgi:hypothetical protein